MSERSTLAMHPRKHPLLICDLTQSYSPRGGGVSTYLREKREYVLTRTDDRILQIVPGPADMIVENGRSIWAEVQAEPVRGSPNYRFILRTKAVRAVLDRFCPDLIESLCPWVLPWTAINYRRANPGCALVAGYHTDFPNAQIHRVAMDLFGASLATGLRRISIGYAGLTYRQFDRIYTLGEEMRSVLGEYGLSHVDLLDMGVDVELFNPKRRDDGFRQRLGLPGKGPLLIYVGRIDNERRADLLVALMRELPADFGAALAVFGDGKLRQALEEQSRNLPIVWRGFVAERHELAVAMASSDIYVSAMPNETFGIAVAEAQASGLPVVGVNAGAMRERVLPGIGRLGPPGDAATMARNVEAIWASDHLAMGRCAHTHALTHYNWERTFDRLFGKFYLAALESAARRSIRPRSPWPQGRVHSGGVARR